MGRDLSDLQRLCLKLASANRIAEGLPPLKFRVGFDDVRLRLRWEPGTPRWISWAKAVAALGCLDDRRVWKVGDDASFTRWRAAATEDAIGRGLDRDSLDALDPESFAVEVAARSPILGVDAYRRAGQRPYSPPFATMAEAERVAEALGLMGVPALAFSNVEAEWPDQIGFHESDLYGWEVLIAGFGFDKHRRMVGGRPAATTHEAPEWLASRDPRDSDERRAAFLAGKRRPCRYRELFDISGVDKARDQAVSNPTAEAGGFPDRGGTIA